ncbi:hypothetical protein ACFXPA_20395 [Amycolatopsis sp. NPDC059090]
MEEALPLGGNSGWLAATELSARLRCPGSGPAESVAAVCVLGLPDAG